MIRYIKCKKASKKQEQNTIEKKNRSIEYPVLKYRA